MATKIRARLRALVSTLTRRTAGERLQQVTDIFGRTYTLDLERMVLVPPLAGADGDGEGDGEGAGAGDDGDDADADGKDEPDWKRESRKHEGRAKSEKRRADTLQAELDKLKNADKSDQDKAIDDAKAEVRAELDAERRHDRLEVAVTRFAARTFADTEDALIHLERAIKDGDVHQDDIFDDDGKVQTEAVKTALTELLERKPHLAAGDKQTPPPGDSDAGKGKGGKGVEGMSPADHLKQIQGRK